MADFFLSAGIEITPDRVTSALRWRPDTAIESGTRDGLFWAVSRIDGLALWGSAFDAESQTRVIIGGRIALEDDEWSAAERLPYTGALAARHLLAQWLAGGADAIQHYNGAATVMVLDPGKGEAHLWTDRMGFHPAFALSSDEGVILCSHPDVVRLAATGAGLAIEIDDATIADFLKTGAPVHPYSYWRQIRHLDAATHYRFRLDGRDGLRPVSRYWRPGFMEGAPDLPRRELVAGLADALTRAVRRRSNPRFGRSAILLSAGADSRGTLFGMADPASAHCYTYHDEPNAELKGAQRIAAAAHASHFPLQRTRNYYIEHADETVRLSGGMWNIESGHHTGFADHIREASSPHSVLTGCYADYLFKGVGLNRTQRRLFSRHVPLYEPAPFDTQFYLGFSEIEAGWDDVVEQRLAERFPADVRSSDDIRISEHLRLSPLSQEGDSCGRLVNWRLLPFDFVNADKDVLDVYGRMSVRDKVSGIAYGQAIARITGPYVDKIKNNNYGASVGANEAGRLIQFLISSAVRKISSRFIPEKPRDSRSIATNVSWPDLQLLATVSHLFRDIYDDISPVMKGHLSKFLPAERRHWSLDEWAARDWVQLYRLMTVALWLRSVGEI